MATKNESANTPKNCFGYCKFHLDTVYNQNKSCSATTNKGAACPYAAKIYRPDYLPVCRIHQDRARAVDHKCPVIELCGKLCDRPVIDQNATYCDKHTDGTPPCHLFCLPTELRLMIFRHLFPKEVTSFASRHEVNIAVFKTCRQIYQEASSVLYHEVTFLAELKDRGIHFQGQYCNASTSTTQQRFSGFGRTKRVCLRISISSQLLYSGPQTDIIACRAMIRNFAAAFDTTSQIAKVLTIRPTICTSRLDDAITALFLCIEPLQALRICNMIFEDLECPKVIVYSPDLDSSEVRELYATHQAHWYQSLHLSRNGGQGSTHDSSVKSLALACSLLASKIRKALEQLETAFRVAYPTADRTGNGFHFPRGAEKVIQQALENKDMLVLSHLRQVIGQRWIAAWRAHQKQLSKWAEPLTDLFQTQDGVPETRHPQDLVPDAFTLSTIQDGAETSSEDSTGDRLGNWGFEMEDSAPGFNDVGVKVTEDPTYVYIRKGQDLWKRMKTPDMIKKLREYTREQGRLAQE